MLAVSEERIARTSEEGKYERADDMFKLTIT